MQGGCLSWGWGWGGGVDVEAEGRCKRGVELSTWLLVGWMNFGVQEIEGDQLGCDQ